VNRSVHSAAACQGRIGGVSNGLRLLLCDITLRHFQNGLINVYLRHKLFLSKMVDFVNTRSYVSLE
jgi:hypothetical protein